MSCWLLWTLCSVSLGVNEGKIVESLIFRGRRSRNKVSVGEPAEGSFMQIDSITLCLSYSWLSSAIANPVMISWTKVAGSACVISHFRYNFQQWISWLRLRWRALQIVISNVNCRTPRNIRILNVQYTSGLSLEVILLQSLESWCDGQRSSCCLGWRVGLVLFILFVSLGWGWPHSSPRFQSIVCAKSASRWHCMCVGCYKSQPMTWSQDGKPAEFKHISKQRKRNKLGFLQ